MAKKKTSTKPKREYTAMTNLTNGGTGKQYPEGSAVYDGDFPAAVIENWLKRGHLEVVDNGGN